MITTQLNHERVGLAAWSGLALSLYEDIVAWAAAQETDDGRTLIEQGWVQMDLARCHAELEAMWLLNWRMAVHVADGELTGGGVVVDQGVRDRADPRGRASAPGGDRRGRLSRPRVAGRAAAGPARGDGRARRRSTRSAVA